MLSIVHRAIHCIKRGSIVMESLGKKISLQSILFIATCLSGLLALFLITRFYTNQHKTVQKNKELAIQTTANAAIQISRCMQALRSIVEGLASDLTHETITPENIGETLKERGKTLSGLGVAYAPYTHDEKTKLFAPYNINREHTQRQVDLGTIVDYTTSNFERFRYPFTHGPSWINPMIDAATNTLILEFAAPFYDSNKKAIGIVFGNYTIDYVQRLVASLYPGSMGYGAIVKTDATFISHPNTENIGGKKTLIDVAKEGNNPKLAADFEKALNGKQLLVYQDTNWISGQPAWIFFKPIPHTQWYTLGTFIVNELYNETQESRREAVTIAISIVIFLVTLLLLILRIYLKTTAGAWLASIAISLGFFVLIIILWHTTQTILPDEPNKIIQKNFDMAALLERINSNQMLTLDTTASLEHLSTMACSAQEDTIANKTLYTLIPTGIFINQLSIDTNTISFGGYVWQRIPLDTQKKINPGIYFTQTKELTIQEAYRKKTEHEETIGWTFHGTLQQNFNYFKYPMDFKHIRIKLTPNSFDNSVVLVPDFDGYKILNPTSLPAINPKCRIPSWNLLQSFFSYQKESHITNYGLHSDNTFNTTNEAKRLPIPQLFFNVIINRQVLSSLVLNLMPIIIILILLFIILLMTPVMEFQFIFGSTASLFFTALIAYTSFKNYLPTQGIIFFDYLYFILEGIILLSTVTGILYHQSNTVKAIKDVHLKQLQLIFWPGILGILFTISLVFFY